MEIVYSLIAASAAMLGSIILITFHKWSEKNSLPIINFTAGVMLTLAFYHLIPEGLELNPNAMIYALLGFSIMFFVKFVVLFNPCNDEGCLNTGHTHNVTSMTGLSLHSFLDGLMIAIGFEVNSNLGVLTTLAILLHKLPDGITVSAILLHSGIKKEKIFNISLFNACFTPIGTVLGMFLLKNISMQVLGALLGITAGSFIFLSASDLIPETHKCKNRTAPLMLFTGIIFILLIEYLVHSVV